jgi:DNA-binding SARP family transcriptional activator
MEMCDLELGQAEAGFRNRIVSVIQQPIAPNMKPTNVLALNPDSSCKLSPQQVANQEALKISRYEPIAELLREVRDSCESAGDESLVCMVDAAYRICQACCYAQDEVEWRRQAYSKAHQRQIQLLQELYALIDLIGAPAVENEYRRPSFSCLADSDRDQPLNAITTGYERLVQCIKDLLGPLPISETVSQCGPPPAENSAEGLSETLSEKTNLLLETDPEGILSQVAEITAMTPSTFIEEADDNAKLTRSSLSIYFLSPFRVLLDGQPVAGWPNCKGKSIFKYLVTHRERPIPKEVLMDVFWPEVDPDAARNNLNVAIHGLRKALSKVKTDFSYVLFQDSCYLLNPELNIWVDADAFMAHVRRAKECERRNDLAAATHEYRGAEAIYQCEFLVEDRYEEWLIATRQNFNATYLAVMNRLSCYYFDQQDYESCVTICARALAEDACNEELHRQLMRCYSLMGHTHLAMRQFHICRETLARELNLTPSRETLQLFEQIRQRQSV